MYGLFTFVPLLNSDPAAKDPGIDADVGDGFGEAKGPARRFAILAGLWGDAAAEVVAALLGCAALVDGGKSETSGEAAGGSSGVDPGEFVGDEREREVFGSGDVAAFFRVHEDRCDAGLVIDGKEGVLLLCPLVCIAGSGGDEASDGSAGDGADGLDEHLEVETVGEAPKDLADVVAREGLQGFSNRGGFGNCHSLSRLFSRGA